MIDSLDFSCQQVPLGDVDLDDRTFVVTCHRDPGELTASLQAVGLVTPPLVRARPDGARQVICGWRRLAAARLLGWPWAPVREAPETTPDPVCLLLSLHDNAGGRGFNPVERAGMLSRLARHWDRETIIREFLPWLGLPPVGKQVDLHRGLADLEAEFQELVARGKLSQETAAALGEWEAADRRALVPCWGQLVLSHSKQRELVDYLTTLARREGRGPGEILARAEVREILENPTLRPPEKTARLWELLRVWVSPRLTAARQQFEAHLESLGLRRHPGVTLTPSPNFEGSNWRLTVEFDSAPGLARTLARLRELSEQEEFERLMRL